MTLRPEGDVHPPDTPESIHLHSRFVPDLISPLTVIKAHAQLIRRRAGSESAADTAQLERSLAAIERAVERIATALEESPTRML